MTIRRIGKTGKTNIKPVSTGKNAATKVGVGENFADQLAHVAGTNGVESVERITPTKAINDVTSQGSKNERREQLEQTGELLESLEELGKNLDPSILIKDGNDDLARQRLKETRDQALRTLSDTPAHSEERDLLHRTALLATVELAKSERGDYK
ncbi:MAG: hypothetical protein HQL69_00565 [Magnetococcales bacterium]|nr:hypothetical protein [Magnetococcales bacterium]